ncbi:MAG: hypothetical protein OXE17_09420 [Chloroflexi bacterium]|nr:hypothetical protein [Chloroflexota bacterium]
MDDEKVTNLMDAYIIENSIEDVLTILDSAPIQLDLMPERNLVQLTNRIPVAHLAIERGMKGLLKRVEGGQEETHSLGNLYSSIKNVDPDSADFLARAFKDAVEFYGYNPKRSGFEQFKSLEEYFSKVGGKKAFDALRYWAIGDPGTGETAIKFISPPIHREILCALRSLLISRSETTSSRVDSQILFAMWDRRHICLTNGDEERKTAIELYRNWLKNEFESPRAALWSKVHSASLSFGHEYIDQVFKEGWDDIQQAEDPAVKYFIHKLTYLPEGSQPQHADASPVIDWLQQDLYGQVNTPKGTCLGFVQKQPDGAWAVMPLGQSAKPIAPAAWKLKDAKNHLVDRQTFKVTVKLGSDSKQLRVFGIQDYFPEQDFSQASSNPDDMNPLEQIFKLEFWDEGHHLSVGDALAVFPSAEMEQGFITILKGKVIGVDEQSVTVKGTITASLNEEVPL